LVEIKKRGFPGYDRVCLFFVVISLKGLPLTGEYCKKNASVIEGTEKVSLIKNPKN